MMTFEEKMKMLNEKKQFIENINEAFQLEPKCGSVEGVTYEVYMKSFGEDKTDFREWIIVHFVGGGKSPRLVSGNSNTANFRVLGQMLNGGYYDEVRDYETQIERGYKVVVPVAMSKLEQLLKKPMKHISDVHKCFEYCTNGADVERVIDEIPGKFGDFTAVYNEDGETFLITNLYESDNDGWQSEEAEYDFYVED